MKINQKMVLALAISCALSACYTTRGKPINSDEVAAVKHVCVQDAVRSSVPNFSQHLKTSLEKQGVTAEVFAGSPPPGCEYVLRYSAYAASGSVPYLLKAKLLLWRGTDLVSAIKYRQRGESEQHFVEKVNIQAQSDVLVQSMFQRKAAADSGVTIE